MNIGIINKKKFTVGTGENQKVVQYLEMSIRPPFMTSATFVVSPNPKKEQGDNKPDFLIKFSYNRKNENYRKVTVGGIWNKTTDSGIVYKSGSIKSPAFLAIGGVLHFAIFEAKPFENEDPNTITWSHEVVWDIPSQDQKDNSDEHHNQQDQYDQASTQAQMPEINVDDEEIPF